MAKNNNDDLFITTQVFSSFSYHKDKEKQRILSANLLNDNGFIIFIKKRSKNGWSNVTNFYCRQDDMPILAKVIELTLKDIENGDYGKERSMSGNKTNISFPKKESNGKLYIGCKITKNKDGKETSENENFLFDTRTESDGDIHKGKIELQHFGESVKNTALRVSTSYDAHFQKYFEKKNEGGSSSGSSSKSKSKPENDEDFPFN